MSEEPPQFPRSVSSMSSTPHRDLKIFIVTPVFNDWASFTRLLTELDNTEYKGISDLRILAVDDGSTETIPEDLIHRLDLKRVRSVCVLKLTRNLGHQRAIAVGLARAVDASADAVVVMDSDGEDRPSDIQLLVDEHFAKPRHIIAASRKQRSEGLLFRVFYVMYKFAFKVLTGREISFGNFSLLPAASLNKLVSTPSLWNHYAATVASSRLPLSLVPTSRGRRYAGRSSMNFVSLVVHGLSAISVFSESMLARILLFFVLATVVGFIIAVVVVALRLFTDLATPGWATSVLGSFAVVFLQALLLAMMSGFLVLNNRSTILPAPIDYAKNFIDQEVWLLSTAGKPERAAPPYSSHALAGGPERTPRA